MGKILVVDDEADVCQLMVKLLRRLGHEAHCANSGAEALSRVKGALPDLILLDVMMPEMSGIEVLKQLRVGEGISIPVIIFTALSDPNIRKQAMELGANDYWVKASMDLHDMTRRLNEHLRAAG
jgi:CheY-like chemotaxis protein